LAALAALWPVFGLVIETPRLRLRLPVEGDLPALAKAARTLRSPGERPFQLPWMYDPSPQMERQLLQRYWRALAHWRPESWHLLLAIYLEGLPIGMQELWAKDFRRIRSVGTGSWVGLEYQGKRYGTEARAGVLELAFGCLGAEEARSEYLDGNIASAKVSARLNYTPNGRRLIHREAQGRLIEHEMRLDRGAWEACRERGRSTIAGFEPCREMFGI
jgi:RimJ/RimL family protein N-acetyltransferase